MSVRVPTWEEFQALVETVGALEDKLAELESYPEIPPTNPPKTLVGAATQYMAPRTWGELISAQESRLGELSVRRVFDSQLPSSFGRSQLRHDNGARVQVWSFKLGSRATVDEIRHLFESVPVRETVYVIPFHEPVDNMTATEYRRLFDKVHEAYLSVPGFAGIGTCLTNWSVDRGNGLDYVQPDKCDFLSIDYYPEMEGSLGVEPTAAMSRAISFANENGLEFQLGEFAVDRSNTRDRDLQLQFIYSLKDLGQMVDRLGPLTYFDVDMDGYSWRIETNDIMGAYRSLRDHYKGA